jgi:hypothetical protein
VRTLYEVSGSGLGTSLFASKGEAEKAANSPPPGWGSAIGNPRSGTVRTVQLFDSVEEWHRYMGHGPEWSRVNGRGEE